MNAHTGKQKNYCKDFSFHINMDNNKISYNWLVEL